jgi:cytochrome c oxidase cbb3-type subunit IV
MDVNTLRTILTLACFAAFVGITVWAFSSSRRERFADAARVPLMEDEHVEPHRAAREGAAP